MEKTLIFFILLSLAIYNISFDKILLNIYILKRRLHMKVLASLKSARKRDKDCRLIRRKGKLIVINKKNPRLKARQG